MLPGKLAFPPWVLSLLIKNLGKAWNEDSFVGLREKQDRQHVNLGSSPKEGDGEGEKRKTGLSESRLAQYGGQQAATWQTSSCMRAGEGRFSPRERVSKPRMSRKASPDFV